MFGYFKLDKACPPELSGAYRKYYCLLCRAMGKQYGVLSRFLLSFDVTFLLIFLAEENLVHGLSRVRCLKTDAALKAVREHELLRQMAALNILLAAGKLEDDRLDEGEWKAKAAEKVFSHTIAAAKKDFPQMWDIIMSEYVKIRSLESAGSDLIAVEEAFAHMMVRLATECFGVSDETKIHLLRMATRWLYFIDAVDDLDENLKENSFNPLVGFASFSNLKNRNYLFLSDHFAQYYKEDVRLTGGINAAIINRVLYYGMPEEMVRVLTKKRGAP